MTQSRPEDRPVTLQEVLDCKERRVRLQRQLLARFALPVVSLTVVMPGPFKDTESSRFLFSVALANIKALCDRNEWRVADKQKTQAITGAEAVLAIDADPETLKRTLVALEDSHPLGRLWDFDVIASTDAPLSRSDYGLPGRKCLMCDEPAFACGRSRRHAVEELVATIEDRVNAFRCS